MKSRKILVVIAILSLLMIACEKHEEKDTKTDGIFYKTEQYKIVGSDDGGNRIIPDTFEYLEGRPQESFDENNKPYGLILECEVAGPSINRILEPKTEDCIPGKIYGINHVLTPVKIEKIHYKPDSVELAVGETYYLMEPFFYITEEAEPYYSEFGDNTIYSPEYSPMQEGYRYIVYASYIENDEQYNYQGGPILGTFGLQEAVYCLSDETTARRVIAYDDSNYWSLWGMVCEKYNHQ